MAIHKHLKKQAGTWAESTIDAYFFSLGWNLWLKNHHFRGGEIDRAYIKISTEKDKYCFAEIKLATMSSVHELPFIFAENTFRKFLKPRQVRNLYTFAEHLSARMFERASRRSFEIHVRVFVVVSFALEDGHACQKRLFQKMGVRLCTVTPQYCVFSVEPEWVGRGQATGRLQVQALH